MFVPPVSERTLILNVDKLTYAGNPESLAPVEQSPRYRFARQDIGDQTAMSALLHDFQPDIVMHLAAESHVDRSIDGPREFIQTNIVGTYSLLEACREYWLSLPAERRATFRFHHVSTDEVYGDLEGEHDLFTETTAYAPSSPYSASKAASDHLVRAWQRTFGLPVVVTNCSNNYGPYHFPEKLIPHMILNALQGKPLPVYGDGGQVRDVPVSPKDILATTYHLLGIDPHTTVPDAQSRPAPIAGPVAKVRHEVLA